MTGEPAPVLTTDTLLHLAEERGSPCASLYLPTERAGPDTRQGPVRLKNLVSRAGTALEARGADPGVLDAARELLDETSFWQHASDGLAMFLRVGVRPRVHRLPRRFHELAVVTDRFHVTPLLPLLEDNCRFHVLAVSRKRVRLIEATRYRECEVELEHVPGELREVVGYDWEQRSLQFHPGGRGGDPPGYHGHGTVSDKAGDELVRYLRAVDAGIVAALPEATLPLVVAAVDEVQSAFRALTSHPDVVDRGVSGNPDELAPATLREKAWPVVQSWCDEKAEEAVARWKRQAATGTGLAGDGLSEVLDASTVGRVGEVLLERDRNVWGTYDADVHRVEMHAGQQERDEDLLNRVAIETLRHGGRVRTLPGEAMPSESPVAATWRYPLAAQRDS